MKYFKIFCTETFRILTKSFKIVLFIFEFDLFHMNLFENVLFYKFIYLIFIYTNIPLVSFYTIIWFNDKI